METLIIHSYIPPLPPSLPSPLHSFRWELSDHRYHSDTHSHTHAQKYDPSRLNAQIKLTQVSLILVCQTHTHTHTSEAIQSECKIKRARRRIKWRWLQMTTTPFIPFFCSRSCICLHPLPPSKQHCLSSDRKYSRHVGDQLDRRTREATS